MKLHRMVILLASAMAMVAVSMVGAAVAQAAEELNKGPLWIVGNPARGLLTGETRAITSRTESPPVLKGSLASVECEKATNKGILLGGSPGTGYIEIKFEGCFLKGEKNCVATGHKPVKGATGEIPVNTLIILAFPSTENRTSAVTLFAAEGETGNENLFTEFEFKNKAGATTELCGAFNEVSISVKAAGGAIKIKSETRDVGQAAEVGMLESTSFVLSTPGLTSAVGLLRFPEAGIKTADVYNGKEYESVKSELTAGSLLGEVREVASAEIEIPNLEPFGWNY
jgi:hypothetical protein